MSIYDEGIAYAYLKSKLDESVEEKIKKINFIIT